jgi:EmrB/QacA subfamily drug resistance transporter
MANALGKFFGLSTMGDPSAGRPASDIRDSRRWFILAVLGVAQLMVVLDTTVVNIALPSAQQALHFSNDQRQWIVTAYSLAFGGLVLLGGKLADIFGRKSTLIVGLSGFALASAVGGLSQSFLMLVAARAVQGAFGALLAPSTLSLLNTTFAQPSERNRAFGVYGAIAGSGASLGLLLGGALTQWLDWRAVMYINVGFAAIALFGALILLRSQAREVQSLDIRGVLAVGLGLFAVVYGLANAETAGWTASLTLAMLAVGVLLLVLFVWIELRVKNPLLPLRLLADRNRTASLLSILISASGMFGVFLFIDYYFQQNLGYSPIDTGVAFLPMTAVLVATSITAQTMLRPRVGSRLLVTVGMSLAVVALLLLTRLGVHANYATEILPSFVLMGLAFGLIFSSAINTATVGVQRNDAGVASAMVNTTQQIGGTMGTAIFSSIYATAVSNYLVSSHTVAVSTVYGYTTAFAVAAGVFFAGALIAATVYKGPAALVRRAAVAS